MTRTWRKTTTLSAAAALLLWSSSALAQEGSPAPPSGPSNASDESQDSGLGLEWVYLNADAGFHYVDIASLSSSQLGIVDTSGSGFTWGVGAGVRLLFLSAGVRLRNSLLSNPGSLWTLDLEAAMHMRVWRIDPYFGVRGGYAWVGSFSTNAVSTASGMTQPDVAVHGFDVGPMVGLDVYFSSLVSVGVEGAAQFLFLQRPPVPLPTLPAGVTQQQFLAMLPPAEQTLYQQSGSSAGFGGAVTAHLGIHF